jgi:hypothetical protein
MANKRTAPALGRPPKKTGTAPHTIYTRVSDELLAALDAHVERLLRERPGSNVTRVDAMREILHRALLSEATP